MINSIEDFSDHGSISKKAKIGNGEFISIFVSEQASNVEWTTAEDLFRTVDALRKNIKVDLSQDSMYRKMKKTGKLSDFKHASGETLLTLPEQSIVLASVQYDDDGNRLEWVRDNDVNEGEVYNLAGLSSRHRLETFDPTLMTEIGTPGVQKYAAEVLRIFNTFEVKS